MDDPKRHSGTLRPEGERPITLFGWIERVSLPQFGLRHVKSKLDTGARTSAIHAEEIDLFDRDGTEWVRFKTVADWEGPDRDMRVVESPVLHLRDIKNTSGIAEERLVVKTRARFGRRSWTIELSLADRTNMTFPMIIGRAALKHHAIAVHTRRAYLISERPAPTPRKDDT